MSKLPLPRRLAGFSGPSVPSLAAAVLILTCAPAAAFQPLVTDDTGTQGQGGNQIEAGISRVESGANRNLTVPLVYTRGLTDALDVFVEGARVRDDTDGVRTQGWSNVIVGAKWRFIECEECRYSLALKPGFTLPVSAATEAEGLGTGKLSWDATLIGTLETSWGAVHANVGIARERYKDATIAAQSDTDSWQASLAPAIPLGDGWLGALDVGFGESETPDGTTTDTRYAELGTVYAPNDDLELALGVIRAQEETAGQRSYATEITAGVTWRFK